MTYDFDEAESVLGKKVIDATEDLKAFGWAEGDILYMRDPRTGIIVHRHRKGTNPDQDRDELLLGGYVFKPPEPGEEPQTEPWRGTVTD